MILLETAIAAPEITAARRKSLSRFLARVQHALHVSADITVLLADDHRLRVLNRQFRGKNKSTDVLSFPADPIFGTAGDLAVSVETAERQAAEHGHSVWTELRILILHGVLHLTGMDHETDSGEMIAKESALRARFRLPAGLIERTAELRSSAQTELRKRRSRTTP